METAVPRCETCKWWECKEGKAWGTCRLTVMSKDVHEHPESLALVSADYVGDLDTHATFGCVQHQPKEGRELLMEPTKESP